MKGNESGKVANCNFEALPARTCRRRLGWNRNMTQPGDTVTGKKDIESKDGAAVGERELRGAWRTDA